MASVNRNAQYCAFARPRGRIANAQCASLICRISNIVSVIADRSATANPSSVSPMIPTAAGRSPWTLSVLSGNPETVGVIAHVIVVLKPSGRADIAWVVIEGAAA
jgi:hypothetical protein